ncbi:MULTISPECIES: hypothetical protein [Burkholderia]|uniref:hypothetical protein n=1 Tax=Burkholderia TaxID=32008 RepID=UPI001589A85F|nr:hypothetical protein [Burkholderia cepacia]MCA8060008.1 hypothetical protein [Burkholderia cepacia]MCA8137263.1 hypothetical protein [Burkholderia cepacia]MCA8163349.1 hypothetical protein [Burkholderia cepacia]HEM7888947.1 hypothetical protein [Burkholderia cepacia]HEM8513925.1 hypothetical protein [Burkholderia cepacia]
MRFLLAMDLVADADSIAVQLLSNLGYKPKPRDTAFDRFAILFTRAERTIPPVPYEVRLSDDIRQNPKYREHRKAFDEIVSRLRKGESVHPYLSTRAVRAAYQDTLLLTWGIHHLHLNSINTVDKRGFVARKHGESELLLLRIKDDTAYLIDIVSHGEPDLFDNPRLLEVVDRNWPELHFAPKAITAEAFSPDQVKALRSNHANFSIHVNGRAILPKAGVTATGVPIEVYGWYRALHAELRNVEADVRRRFYEFFPHSTSPLLYLPAVQNVRLIAIEPELFVLQHHETQRVCHARRVVGQKQQVPA